MINCSPEYRDGFFVDEARKKLWSIEIEMLENFKEICERHSLDWFLIGGAAIGAVRHKGFIPWDDDIDIGMRREDFEKFIVYAQNELRDAFVLQYGLSEEKDEFYYLCRIRDRNSTGIIGEEYKRHKGVMGIFIEIYPFDVVPENKFLRTLQWKFSMVYIEIICNYVYGTEMGGLKTYLISKIISKDTQKIFRRWIKCCTRYNKREGKLVDTVSVPVYSASEVDLFFREDVISTIMVPFENTMVNVGVGNERCLRKTYGDYMKFPPVEERGMHQAGIFYDPFNPYDKYIR